MADTSTLNNNSLDFTDWKIQENGDGHLHFKKNDVQKEIKPYIMAPEKR